ncbi:MAG: hypothetical protein JO170_08980 [Verrucomicrobia bacterium]|nr:hypothetical protein [Verrucomicrobiota bacterium]
MHPAIQVHAISVLIIPIYGKRQRIVFRPIDRQTDRWEGASESESTGWVTHLHRMPVFEVGKAAKLRQPDTLGGGSIVFCVRHGYINIFWGIPLGSVFASSFEQIHILF